jgi:hypothetical protein
VIVVRSAETIKWHWWKRGLKWALLAHMDLSDLVNGVVMETYVRADQFARRPVFSMFQGGREVEHTIRSWVVIPLVK